MMRIRDVIVRAVNSGRWSLWCPGRGEVNRAFALGLNTRRAYAILPVTQQTQQMLATLQAIVKHARMTVPYYTDLMRDLPSDFPASFSDYCRLQPLDKMTIRQEGNRLLSTVWPKESLVREATGGSTGEPVIVYSTRADYGWALSGHHYYQRLLGCPRGSRIATLYGGELDVAAKVPHWTRLKNWLTNYSLHGCFRLDEDYLLSVHDDFSDFQPDMIVAYASALHLLACVLERYHLHPRYPRKVLLTGAEKLEDYQRAVIERVFSVPVVERYGSRDVGLMAYQLPGHGFDFWIDQCYCLIEPDGNPDENGYAPILVTTLRRRAMPLLRYRIGDIGCFSPGWQPDQPASRLQAVVGRTLDYIYLSDQRRVHSAEFPHLFKDYDIIAYQVVQQSDASVCVSVVPGPNYDEQQRQQMQRIVCDNLSGVTIEFQYVTELKRTDGHSKLRPVISRYRPEQSADLQ